MIKAQRVQRARPFVSGRATRRFLKILGNLAYWLSICTLAALLVGVDKW
jgi:4-hydroxybenzoate polyprenyltransferase